MLSPLTFLLLASAPTAVSSASVSPGDDCAAIRRLDLTPPVLSPPRICVSPGLLTGVLFNQPVDVELQDEVRFTQVIRGREGVGFIPPSDLPLGESLLLTAVLQVGGTRQRMTFVLVAHPGQGSHQVDVSYHERSWQSLNEALGQEMLANRRLSEESAALEAEAARLRAQLAQPTGLSAAYSEGQLNWEGITTRSFVPLQEPAGALAALKAVSYRGHLSVAVELLLEKRTPEPWKLEKAVLVNAQGQTLTALRLRQADALLLGATGSVFVEFDPTNFALEGATLTLADADGRGLSIPNMLFP